MKARFRTHTLLVLSVILQCGALENPGYCQEVRRDSLAASGQGYQAIFEKVQAGISAGSVEPFAKHLAAEVVINLRGDESGTFSSKQAYYVLKNFFDLRRFGGFEFSTIADSDANPYAAGSAEFTYKGAREDVQVYVALAYAGEKYVITQLTIY